MKDIMGLMKQAKEMQAKMQAAQAQVSDTEATGRSGGGLVTVTLAGGGNMKALTLDPTLMDGAEDKEMLEDLIIAAYQDAKVKLDQAAEATMKSAMGDIPLPPGMKMPF